MIQILAHADSVRLRDWMLPHMPACCLYKLRRVRASKVRVRGNVWRAA